MKTTTNPSTSRHTARESLRGNHARALSAPFITTNVLAARLSCTGDFLAARLDRRPDCPAPTNREKASTARLAVRHCASLARGALLPSQGKWVSAESSIYFLLTATIAVSLVMAFWQLHALEAGWGSFVELVAGIVS